MFTGSITASHINIFPKKMFDENPTNNVYPSSNLTDADIAETMRQAGRKRNQKFLLVVLNCLV